VLDRVRLHQIGGRLMDPRAPYQPPDFDPGPFDTDEVNRRSNTVVVVILATLVLSIVGLSLIVWRFW
jgi:hypothetical protein